MKKIFLLLTLLMIIFNINPVMAEEEPLFIFKIDGYISPCISEGSGSVEFTYVNKQSGNVDAMLFGAAYTNNLLTDAVVSPYTLLSGENVLSLDGLSIGADSTCVKIMLLCKNTMSPLIKEIEITESEPCIESFTVTLGTREYMGYIDHINNTISLEVPLYTIPNNAESAPINSNNVKYKGTPDPDLFNTQIQAVTPQITPGKGNSLISDVDELNLLNKPLIKVRNDKSEKIKGYTVLVDTLTVQRDMTMRGNVALATPATTQYNAGKDLRRHNAPLGKIILGSGVWHTENFAFKSLSQSSYNPSTDRTEDTPGYNVAVSDGVRMVKDRDGLIGLRSVQSNAPNGNILSTLSEVTLNVEEMTGDGMKIYFGENRGVLRIAPSSEDGQRTCRLWFGSDDKLMDTGFYINMGQSYDFQCISKELGDGNSRGSLFVNGKLIYTLDYKPTYGYRLDKYHVRFLMLENTRGKALLQDWRLAYCTKPIDLGNACSIKNITSYDGITQNIIDGDYASYWSSEADKSEITFELQELMPVSYIGIAFYAGISRQYKLDVQVSEDGSSFIDVRNGYLSNKTSDMQPIDLNGVYNTKFIRLVCYGNDVNKWNSITEVKVYSPSEGEELHVAQDGPSYKSGLCNMTYDQQELLRNFERKFSRLSLWTANLYDNNTGGFYMAKSGKDDPEQEPGLEMTFFALNNIYNNFDNRDGMPESVKNKFINFIIDRQDPETGLFIDKQGTVNSRETARNQSAVLPWVNRWNIQLPYVHPGQKTRSINLQSVNENVIPDYLESTQTYIEWIEGWDWDNNSWTAGDQVANSLVYLRYMDDAEAQAYRDALIEWLANRQFENGLWADKINFNSISGAFKLGNVYSQLGMQFPDTDKVLESTITCMKTQTPTVIHFVRNPISVLKQIAGYSQEYADVVKQMLLENIDIILSWVDIFMCPDGGFSMYQYKSQSNFGGIYGSHQLWEGDVDSTAMILTVRKELYDLLGITTPKIVLDEDFWNWLEGTKIIPSPYLEAKYDEISIESYKAEQGFEGFAVNTKLNGTELGGDKISDKVSAAIVYDNEKAGNVLELKYNAGQAGINANGLTYRMKLSSDVALVRYLPFVSGRTTVVEYDIKFDGCKSTDNLYISYGNDGYMLSFGGNGDQKAGVRVNPANVNYNGTFATLADSKWYNIRIEYTDCLKAEDFICKIYIDDELVSENTYLYKCTDTGAIPDDAYGRLSLTWYMSGKGTVYIDNAKTSKK